MPTTRANLYIDQGVDFNTTLEFFADDDGSEYDLLNYNFYSSVKKIYSDTALFDIEVAVIAGDPVNDAELSISKEKTANVKPGKYQYDVLMEKTDGSMHKVLEGLLIINQTITKPSA